MCEENGIQPSRFHDRRNRYGKVGEYEARASLDSRPTDDAARPPPRERRDLAEPAGDDSLAARGTRTTPPISHRIHPECPVHAGAVRCLARAWGGTVRRRL